MVTRIIMVSILILGSIFNIGCGKDNPGNKDTPPADKKPAPREALKSDPAKFPDLPKATSVEKGVLFHEVSIPSPTTRMKVWIYLPEKPIRTPIPCVAVPPAGSPLFIGMDLGAGDKPEQLPYVRQGFAVVSFELDGHVPNFQKVSDQQIYAGAKAFVKAEAGLANARWALDYVLAKVPAIDPKRIYCAGHSSAGTLSLLMAEKEPRIQACIAFAPVSDLRARLSPMMGEAKRFIPDFSDWVTESSPINHAASLKCPLFLFHAQDDNNVKVAESDRFAEEVKKTNNQVEYVRVQRGGHYDSMVHEGIPQAIDWLKKLQK